MRLSVFRITLKATAAASRMSYRQYFDVNKVFYTSPTFNRHAVESIDGKTITEDAPHIVKEHLFVISYDDVQDYHSVHKAQELMVGYLGNQLQMKINKLHR
mgnify:FL=1